MNIYPPSNNVNHKNTYINYAINSNIDNNQSE
jgi:hypothetical protein